MDHLQELLQGAKAAANPSPVPVTENQKKALDAMVVMYMGAATNALELPEETAAELMPMLDQKWEALFSVDPAECTDVEPQEELLQALESVANFMRGATMDPSLSKGIKEALACRVSDIDQLVAKYV